MTTHITDSVPESSNEIQAWDASERHPNTVMSAGHFPPVRAGAAQSDPICRSRVTHRGEADPSSDHTELRVSPESILTLPLPHLLSAGGGGGSLRLQPTKKLLETFRKQVLPLHRLL